jgi:Tol biopolymer transport system component
MPDLDDRFRSIRDAPAPELWREIVSREPRSDDGAPLSPLRKLAVVALAFVVAAFAIAFLVQSFRGGAPRNAPASVGPVTPRNGAIYYVVIRGGPDTTSYGSVEPDGSNQHITLDSSGEAHLHEIAFSPDGTRIAFADGTGQPSGIGTLAVDGSHVAHLTSGVNDAWPSWSPDGSMIAFSSTAFDPGAARCAIRVDYDCPSDLYVMNADGSDLRRLTGGSGPEFQPVWSPDGMRIAFVRSAYQGDAHTRIWVMNADGSAAQPVAADVGGSQTWPAWSPDGSLIVFVSVDRSGDAIYGVAPDGGGVHVIRSGNGIDTPAWSPDGSLIAYTAVDPQTGLSSLYTMRPDGSGSTLIATDRPPGIAADIAWQPVP